MAKEHYEISILYNDNSGSGQAVDKAAATAKAIMGPQFDCNLVSFSGAVNHPRKLDYEGIDAAIIIGGDGTIVHGINQSANCNSARKPPIIAIPGGSENLLITALRDQKLNKKPKREKEPVIEKLEERLWPEIGLTGTVMTPGEYHINELSEAGNVWWVLTPGDGISMTMLSAIEKQRRLTPNVRLRQFKAGLKTLRKTIRRTNSVRYEHYDEKGYLIDTSLAWEASFLTGFPGFWSRMNVAGDDSDNDYLLTFGRNDNYTPLEATREVLRGMFSNVFLRRPIPLQNESACTDFITKTRIRPEETIIFEPNPSADGDNYDFMLDSEIKHRRLPWKQVRVQPRNGKHEITVYTLNN